MLNEFSKNEKDFLMFLFVHYENFYKKKEAKLTKKNPKNKPYFLRKVAQYGKIQAFTTSRATIEIGEELEIFPLQLKMCHIE